MSSRKRNQLENIRKIALIGFTGPNQAMLEYCFSSAVDCELVTASSAAIIIINGDQAHKDDEVQVLINEKYPEAHKLVISIRDLSWDGYSVLKKPHTSQDLLKSVRTFDIASHQAHSKPVAAAEKRAGQQVRPEDVDVFRGGEYSKKRQGEALKQKLMRGNLVVSASDRLVKQIEVDIKEQEAELHANLEAEKIEYKKAILAKKKALKIKELKQKKLELKKRQLLIEKAQKKKLAEKQAKDKSKKLDSSASDAIISTQLSSVDELQRCGNSGDVDLTKSDERRSIFLNAEDSLLVKMREAVDLARKQEHPVEIEGLPGKMYFFPKDNVFYSTFSDDFLNQLALTRFGYKELSLQSLEDFELEDKSKHLSEDVETLIWKVAIWTARGRLFNGMDPDKQLQLSIKPDFVRFLALPNCEAISEVWVGHKMSALDVVKILDVPQRVVFSFMSGAYSLGWFQE
jgi:hypothetical protein